MEFHQTYGTFYNREISDDVPVEIRKVRLRLALEELQELAEAMGLAAFFAKRCEWLADQCEGMEDTLEVNLVEVADALADIDYVNERKHYYFWTAR